MVYHRVKSTAHHIPPVAFLQGHIDMVCEKNADKVHDFFQDPLTLVRDGDWLKADGTTLGADNGLGVATALALLDMPASAPLPPLECLFTVDEETGLTGSARDANNTCIITPTASTCTSVLPPTPDATVAQHAHGMCSISGARAAPQESDSIATTTHVTPPACLCRSQRHRLRPGQGPPDAQP